MFGLWVTMTTLVPAGGMVLASLRMACARRLFSFGRDHEPALGHGDTLRSIVQARQLGGLVGGSRSSSLCPIKPQAFLSVIALVDLPRNDIWTGQGRAGVAASILAGRRRNPADLTLAWISTDRD